jgi:hypothetical protein
MAYTNLVYAIFLFTCEQLCNYFNNLYVIVTVEIFYCV